MDPISERLGAHYEQTFRRHGATSEGVDWGSDSSRLALRYDRMLDVARAEPPSGWSMLDVGCGYGGLLEHARALGLQPQYHGMDISQAMIDWARRHHSDASFACCDILSQPLQLSHDYVTCNGVLTQKLDTPLLAMDEYAQRLVRTLYTVARKGVAFNIMTTKVNFFAPNLYYRNPIEMLGWCMSELTPHVRLDHSYPLYEYTIYLYKAPQ